MLGAIIYSVNNYYGLVQSTIGVKGANTDRAHEISDDIKSDISKQADSAATNASNVKVGDVFGFFARFQKIPEDLNNAKDYTLKQFENLTHRDK